MPAGTQFATKPELALDMTREAVAAGMPAAWVAADEAYAGDRAPGATDQGSGGAPTEGEETK